MTLVDFIIGFMMVNAVPHFILGIYKCRFLGLFGYSPAGNIAYAILCFCISLGLFLYTYGLEGIWQNGIFVGGMFIVVTYFLTGKFLHYLFHTRYYKNKK